MGSYINKKLTPEFRVIMFLSFRLSDAELESRYNNSERECLAVVRCRAEIRWLMMGKEYPVIVYTDHETLKSILMKGSENSVRIANWQDRSNKYNYEIKHMGGKKISFK